ncbi:MAG: patatin-like phospholipase family protein [Rhodothalassiaceae bacterium]
MADEQRQERPARIGLALGSGGALGWAHIGVLRGLQAVGIHPEIITGCSMGAVVGAFYADGKLDILEEEAGDLSITDVMRLLDVRLLDGGLLGGDRIRDFLLSYFGRKPIQELAKPFATVATDLLAGEAVIFDRGPLVEAVRASIAVPGVLRPVISAGRVLVDGQITVPVPVALARQLGADLVIAVDVQGDYVGRTKELKLAEKARDKGRIDTASVAQAAFALLNQQFDRACLQREPADLVIEPKTGILTPTNFRKAHDAIKLGRRAAEEALPALEALKREADHSILVK